MKQKPSVLITGASRGIGRSCALLLAKQGFHIFLNSAHHLDQLESVIQIRSAKSSHRFQPPPKATAVWMF